MSGASRRDQQWWAGWLSAVEEFRAEHGHTDIPVNCQLADGRWLGSWVSARRRDFRNGTLADDEVAMLAAVGIDVRVQGPAARRRTQAVRAQEQWNQRLAALSAFRDRYGHVDVPQRYVTEDGFRLGGWLSHCRDDHRNGTLDPQRAQQLTEIGVELDTELARWLRCLAELAKYRDEHGHGNVPGQYQGAGGYWLGDWLRRCREAYRAGTLPPNRARALTALGVDLDLNYDDLTAARWNAWVADLTAYRDEHGHAGVPVVYVTPEGRKLGSWLAGCRKKYRKGELAAAQVAELVGLGVNLNLRTPNVGRNPQQSWDTWISELESYRTIYGTADVPATYVTPLGAKLGDWLDRCKTAARQGKLPTERRQQLRKLGVAVPRHDSLHKRTPHAERRRWNIGITALQAYAAEHGHFDPPATYTTPDGYRLGGWLARRREEYRNGDLSTKQEKQLRDLGVTLDPGSNKGASWQAHEQQGWNDWIRLLAEYKREHGDVHAACSYRTPDGRPLGMWLSNCRRKYRQGRLAADRMAELSALGVDFDTNGRGSLDARFDGWVRALAEYRDEHGRMPPGTYRTPDGRPLGQWLAGRRTDHRKGKLSPERVQQLRSIGVELD